MEQVLVTLLGFFFINFVYLFFKFFTAIALGVHDNQLFLGYGKHEAFKIRIKKLTIYFGLFIPLPWLAKFYSYNDGVKGRITYEWEFYERQWGLRLLVIFAGSIGSLLTSMLIYSILSYQELEQYISKEELNKFGIYPSEFASSSGFKKGDRILSLNGEDYDRFENLLSPANFLDDSTSYLVLRDKDTINIQPSWDVNDLSINSSFIFVPNAPHTILSLIEGMAAEESGIEEGDIITMIDSIDVNSIREIGAQLQMYAGDYVTIQVKRDEEFHEMDVKVSENGMIGFHGVSQIEYSFYHKTISEAVVEGILQPLNIIELNLKGLARVLGAEVATRSQLNGPIRVANMFGGWSIAQFFRVCALLMAIIPLWDLFPFPKSAALKGVPLILEVVFKKKIPYSSFVKIKNTGWIIIVVLIVVSVINDTMSLF